MVGRSEADDISPEYDAETSKQANGLDNGKLMALSAELSHGVAHRWMETWLLELSDTWKHQWKCCGIDRTVNIHQHVMAICSNHLRKHHRSTQGVRSCASAQAALDEKFGLG